MEYKNDERLGNPLIGSPAQRPGLEKNPVKTGSVAVDAAGFTS
jgi:hypothetical protein